MLRSLCCSCLSVLLSFFFFFNDTATTEIYTLSLHDALPILVELLVDRVIVRDGEVEIRYVIPTSSEGPHARFCHLRLDYLCRPLPPIAPEKHDLVYSPA